MAERLKINQNALFPVYQVTLIDGNGNKPSLFGASVIFHLRQINTTVDKVSAPATVVDDAHGVVAYLWQTGDTDSVGLFSAFWTVTFADGSVVDYPSDTADLIEITTGPTLGYDLVEACAPWTTCGAVRMSCHALSSLTGSSGYVTDETITTAINAATDLLYVLSGRQFSGECLQVVRPCSPRNCFSGPYISGQSGVAFTGMLSDPSSWPPNACGCGMIPSIDLGYWPVTNIIQVRIDGVPVDPSTYRLDQNRYLVRTATGPGFVNPGWPSCQFLDRAATDVGTFEVILEVGYKPPSGGVNAANHLVCEFVKLALGQPCNLPGRVTSVNRQQISFTMINASMLNDGLTGLYDVDLFIIAYNPHKQRGSTVVWSPDLNNQSYRAGS